MGYHSESCKISPESPNSLEHFKNGQVATPKILLSFVKVLLHVLILNGSLIWHEGGCPDLAVGMGVGASHHCSLVLEDLHPSESNGKESFMFLSEQVQTKVVEISIKSCIVSRITIMLDKILLLVLLAQKLELLNPCINDMPDLLNGHYWNSHI